MTLRKLASTDLVAYRRLRIQSLVTDPNAFFLQHKDAVKHPEAYFLSELGPDDQLFGFYGSFNENELIGMVSLQSIPKQAAQIFTFYVSPGHRSQGVGRELLNYVMTTSESAGVHRFRLTVIEGNPAVKLYQSMGFVQVGRNPMVLKNENGVFDELVFEKC